MASGQAHSTRHSELTPPLHRCGNWAIFKEKRWWWKKGNEKEKERNMKEVMMKCLPCLEDCPSRAGATQAALAKHTAAAPETACGKMWVS